MTRAKGRRVMAEDFNDVDFYSVYDGTKGRPEGFYLDMKERHDAEDVRAKMEGREPNHEDEGSLPAAVGTRLVVEADRVDNRYYSNPATNHGDIARDVDPLVTLPVDTGDADTDVDLSYAAQVARERKAQDDALLDDTSQGTPGDESGESTDNTRDADFTVRDSTV